ncbi:MAG: ABC-type transport auxiliary lipoprotein family protein [Acetobacteraceae bacterium]
MNRRAALLALPLLPLALGGCSSLLSRPYIARQDWAFDIPMSPPKPARRGGKVLLVRSVAAAPELADRGLKTLSPDGTMQTDFYERWAVAPADGVAAALSQYLAQSGLFAAVLAPGSLAQADLALEPELLRLWAEPKAHRAVAQISIVLIKTGTTPRVLLQASETARTPLAKPAQGSPTALAEVTAERAALAEVFGKIAAALRPFA